MTSEEILLALRLVAMGRPAHDEVKRLADFLAAKEVPMTDYFKPASGLPQVVDAQVDAEAVAAKPKRTKKAD